jgi:hypothetical protein
MASSQKKTKKKRKEKKKRTKFQPGANTGWRYYGVLCFSLNSFITVG